MCGFLTGQQVKMSDMQDITQALQKIEHRGPDGHAIEYIGEHVFLGHRRLSIVDVAGGAQPLKNENGNIIAVVNGEFYDFKEIRQQLQAKGHTFATHSDSEILIHLYEDYGTDCLRHLHGEFAFVLYDKAKKLWFAARDRMGIRPINYSIDSNGILFASEAKSIIALQKGALLNKDNVWFSQHFQYLPQNGTFFENIHMIPPAHYAVFHNEQLQLQQYWEFPTNITTDSYDVAGEKIEHLLHNAVERRLPDEVKYCTHLSGGIDSSIITYLASQKNPVDCFTVAFTDDEFYNELGVAKEVASHIGANLHIVPVTYADSLAHMKKAIYHAEGLSINGHLGAKYLLNEAIAKAGFKVALSGEGSDEIFMGYSHLKADFLSADKLQNMEKDYLGGIQLPSGQTLDLSVFENKVGFVPTWIAAKSSIAFKMSALWHKNFQGSNPVDAFLQESDATGMYAKYGKNKTSSLLWSRYCLSGYILKVLDDAQSMASSIEGRLPFLDTQLMEYVWSLPDEYYFKGDIEKSILRKMFKHKLPDAVINKTKQSFMSPPVQRALQQSACRDIIYGALLENPHFEKQQMFDRHALEKALVSWESDSSPSVEPVLMTLLSIAMLCEQYKL